MDFLIILAFRLLFELVCPTPSDHRGNGDLENGAAYFFSTAGMEHNREYTGSQEPKDGVEW